jgi:endonuclease-3
MAGNPNSRAVRKRARAVNLVLTSAYGRKELRTGGDPLDTLVETILSQNTSDLNSHRAFRSLKDRYPQWDEILDADSSEVAQIIRSGGLADIKARRIIGALNYIVAEAGSLDLSFLSERSVKEATEWLCSIDGVGPKTAAIVLLFSFGRPTFPVDTHVYRVGRRLGLVSPRASRESAQVELESLVPESEYYNMHLNMIEHGRRVCKARGPGCSECEVSRYCAFSKTP